MTHGPWVCGPGCSEWEKSRQDVLDYEQRRQAGLKAWLLEVVKKNTTRFFKE